MDLTKLRLRIKDRIDDRIEDAPCDGINAEGEFSDRVLDVQQSFAKGMRSARAAALNEIDEWLAREREANLAHQDGDL